MSNELQRLLEKKVVNEKKFNFKGYIKNLKLKSPEEKKLIDFLNKNKDGVEGPEDVFRAATDLKIRLDEDFLNEETEEERIKKLRKNMIDDLELVFMEIVKFKGKKSPYLEVMDPKVKKVLDAATKEIMKHI